MALELALLKDGQDFATHGGRGTILGRENDTRKSTGEQSSVQNTLSRLCSFSLGRGKGQRAQAHWSQSFPTSTQHFDFEPTTHAENSGVGSFAW